MDDENSLGRCSIECEKDDYIWTVFIFTIYKLNRREREEEEEKKQ